MPAKEITEEYLLKLSGKKYLNEIETLHLADQEIETLDVGVFNKLTWLSEVDLSNNLLRDIPRDLTLPKLETLDLSENELSSVEFVTQFPQLQFLYLDKNKQLERSDIYIAAYLCPTLDEGSQGRQLCCNLQSHVSAMVDKLSYKVKGVWGALYKDNVKGGDLTDEEKGRLLTEFTAELQKSSLRDNQALLKFQNFILHSMAEQVIEKIGEISDTVQMGKRVPKRKRHAFYKDDDVLSPTSKASKAKHKTAEKCKSQKKEKKVKFTKLKPRENLLPRVIIKLPSISDYDPVHFVRCHSYQNNPNDSATQVWRCAFEPDPENPAKNTDIVATCGGLVVSLLGCQTGIVMKRYKHDEDGESFYCLAWTTVTMETEVRTFPTNLLAVAGEKGVTLLIHPLQLVVYAVLKGRKEAIHSLMFRSDIPTQLFCGSADGKITIWDIGIPDPVTYSTNYRQLLSLQCPGTEVLNMVYSPSLNWLVAGCDQGCFGWNLKNYKKALRQPTLEFFLPESDGEDCVDGLVLLPNNIIATKCVGQTVIYLWSLKKHITDSVGKSTRVMDVDALFGLQFQHTSTPYISMFSEKGVVVVGDDSGSVLMYNLKEMTKTGKFRPGVAKPSRKLLWPEVSEGENSVIRGDSLHEATVNMCGLSSDGEYLVTCADNNLVGLWRRN